MAGLNELVRGVVGSGLNGEMRPGDTLGVWTYNAVLLTGQFPLQRFTPDAGPEISLQLTAFLKRQKYDNNPQWNAVMPALAHVVEASPTLTVILLTAGTEAVQGTPFDSQLNKAMASWREPQQKSRMPIITILRAQKGKLSGWAVSAPPWPIEVPPLPTEPPAPKPATPAQKPTPSVASSPPTNAPQPKAPPPMGQPLIVSGKKREPVLPTTDASPRSTAVTTMPAEVSNTAPVLPVPAAPAQAPVSAAARDSSPARIIPDQAPPVATAAPEVQKSPEQPAVVVAPVTSNRLDNTGETPGAPASLAARSDAVVQTPADTGVAGATPVAVAPAAPHSNQTRLIWLVGAVAAGAAVIAAFLVLKRSRPREHVSLITRSFERQQPDVTDEVERK
jgi:hypothetical protein